MAESIRRRSLMILEAWERLRARRNPGTAMAASRAMIATTIMISTRVKPPRLVVSLLSMARSASFYLFFYLLREVQGDVTMCWVSFSQLIPCHRQSDDRRMNRQILSYRVTRTS